MLFWRKRRTPVEAADQLIILFNSPHAIRHLFWCEQLEPVAKSTARDPERREPELVVGNHKELWFLIDRQAYLRQRIDRVIAASRRARAQVWIAGYASDGQWSVFVVASEGSVERYLWSDRQRSRCPCDGGQARSHSEDRVALHAEGGKGIQEALKEWPTLERNFGKAKREVYRIHPPTDFALHENKFVEERLTRLKTRVRIRDLRIEQAWTEY
jgi:hypothetical protein